MNSKYLTASKWIAFSLCVLTFYVLYSDILSFIPDILTFQLKGDYRYVLYLIPQLLICFFCIVVVLFFSSRFIAKYSGKHDIRWFGLLICVLPVIPVFLYEIQGLDSMLFPSSAWMYLLMLLLCGLVVFKGKGIIKSILIILSTLLFSAGCIQLFYDLSQTATMSQTANIQNHSVQYCSYAAMLILSILTAVFYFIGSARAAKALSESTPDDAPETTPEQ